MTQTLDLAGIGAGPSNLSLAALAEPVRGLTCRFFERQTTFSWHPGVVFPDSELQVSYLKDLVTLVDPTNTYTFLNFLARTGRMHRFASIPNQTVTRLEFESYYRWCTEQLDNVEAGTAVHEVEFKNDRFLVQTSRGAYSAQNLAIGSGPSPVMPACAAGHSGKGVFHSSQFTHRSADLTGKRVIVVGGGQSGAEIVCSLLGGPHEQRPGSLVWISQRPGFLQLDDSAFTNEWFHPEYVRYFHGLPEGRRNHLVSRQKLASDGISASLLERIYRRLYQNDFVDREPLPYLLLPGRELTDITPMAGNRGFRLVLDHLDTRQSESVEGDVIVLATGYRFRIADYLSPLAARIPLNITGEPLLQSDYSARWDGPPANKLFFLNAGRLSHGIADPNLSLSSWRAATVLSSLTGARIPADGGEHENTRIRSSCSWQQLPSSREDNHPNRVGNQPEKALR